MYINHEADKDIILVSIFDDGISFDFYADHEGVGIVGMKERAYAFDGSMEVMSRKGIGTSIIFTFPISKQRLA